MSGIGITAILKRMISPVTDIIDKAVIDKDKKKELLHDLELALIETAEFFEQQITDRHKYDMQSDSKLSKNIRPLALAFLLFMFTVISVFDGNIGQFSINQSYIPVYEMLLMTAFAFYFGGRSIEKSVKIYKEKD